VHSCCMWQVRQNKRCTKILGGKCSLFTVEAPVDRKSQENLVQYFLVQKLVLWSTSVLEKAAYKFLVARLVRQRSYNVDELQTVTVSQHYELSLVIWRIEHVKQMHHFIKVHFVKF
jgi:hypothetical protein